VRNVLGVDMSGVRILVDRWADEANAALSSRAFSVGQEAFVRPREYRPGTLAGDLRLAHERDVRPLPGLIAQ
jgi:hypothetical protein